MLNSSDKYSGPVLLISSETHGTWTYQQLTLHFFMTVASAACSALLSFAFIGCLYVLACQGLAPVGVVPCDSPVLREKHFPVVSRTDRSTRQTAQPTYSARGS